MWLYEKMLLINYLFSIYFQIITDIEKQHANWRQTSVFIKVIMFPIILSKSIGEMLNVAVVKLQNRYGQAGQCPPSLLSPTTLDCGNFLMPFFSMPIRCRQDQLLVLQEMVSIPLWFICFELNSMMKVAWYCQPCC